MRLRCRIPRLYVGAEDWIWLLGITMVRGNGCREVLRRWREYYMGVSKNVGCAVGPHLFHPRKSFGPALIG